MSPQVASSTLVGHLYIGKRNIWIIVISRLKDYLEVLGVSYVNVDGYSCMMLGEADSIAEKSKKPSAYIKFARLAQLGAQ